MQVNAKKSHVWATTIGFRTALSGTCVIEGEVIPLLTEERYLGAYLSYGHRRARTRLSRTLADCQKLCQRIQMTQLPLEARAVLVSSLVIPKATYASAACASNKKDLRAPRAACTRAVWGLGQPWRSNEIVFSLFAKGHVCDPVQADPYRVLITARQVLARHPETWGMYTEVWERRWLDASCPRTGGPVAAIMQACRTNKIEMPNPGQLVSYSYEGQASEMSITSSEKGKYEHFVRDALRQEEWWRLDIRRRSFDRVRQGIDRPATLTLQNRLNGLDKYRWRCILAGAVATMTRLHRNGQVDSPLCLACALREEETSEHIFARCPAYEHIRSRSMFVLESIT